jgi:hypothetical protein
MQHQRRMPMKTYVIKILTVLFGYSYLSTERKAELLRGSLYLIFFRRISSPALFFLFLSSFYG